VKALSFFSFLSGWEGPAFSCGLTVNYSGFSPLLEGRSWGIQRAFGPSGALAIPQRCPSDALVKTKLNRTWLKVVSTTMFQYLLGVFGGLLILSSPSSCKFLFEK